MTTQLTKYDDACRAIAAAKSTDEVRKIRLSADALRAYARQAKNRILELDAIEIRIRAERRVGELMDLQRKSVGLAKGHRYRSAGTSDVDAPAPTLAEAGIDDHLADNARKLVRLSAESFEAAIADWRTSERDAIRASLIRFAVDSEKRPPPTESIPMPHGRYRTIVIDPPWPLKKSVRIDTPEQGARTDYPPMSLDAIAALGDQIQQAATTDAHLYLWVTHALLPNGLALLEQWGFRYHCVLTWQKPSGFTPFSWMFNTEHVLFAYRGAFSMERKGLKIGFAAPTGRHSEKPDAFYQLVLQASPAPRLEMFARTPRDGFTVWGDEVHATVHLSGRDRSTGAAGDEPRDSV